jgi:hypothetical protein
MDPVSRKCGCCGQYLDVDDPGEQVPLEDPAYPTPEETIILCQICNEELTTGGVTMPQIYPKYYETLTRGDGATTRVKADVFQHDPYTAYLPLSVGQIQRLRRFQDASTSIGQENGTMRPTTEDPLRWGAYHARVIAMLGKPGVCPHCQSV